MRELDAILMNTDNDTIVFTVMAEEVPGIDEEIQQATVRMTIEEALGVIDDLKRTIKNALEKR